MQKRSAAEVKQLIARTPERPRDTFPSSAHHLHNYLHLVSALGANPAPVAPRLVIAPRELEEIRARFSIPTGRKVIGLNPGAEYGPAKRWPAEYFVETAVQVHRRSPVHWLITGGPFDQSVAAQIAAGIQRHHPTAPVCNLAGRTTLRELCAALAACDAVLTNDTGPMHVAAAVGARLVVPFGSTSPELTGPGLPRDPRHALVLGRAPCAPCFLRVCPVDFRCMHSVTPDSIAAALNF